MYPLDQRGTVENINPWRENDLADISCARPPWIFATAGPGGDNATHGFLDIKVDNKLNRTLEA